MRTDISVTIPDSTWQPVGDERDEGGESAVLLSHLTVNGVDFHVTAYEVVPEDPESNARYVQRVRQTDDSFEAIAIADGVTDPYTTMEIAGREYAVVILPYGE